MLKLKKKKEKTTMDKHGIAILADNPPKSEEIAKAFEDSGRFTIIGKTTDGEEGVNMILKNDAEFCVTDLILSGLDGLGVLDRLKAYGSKSFIVLSRAKRAWKRVFPKAQVFTRLSHARRKPSLIVL